MYHRIVIVFMAVLVTTAALRAGEPSSADQSMDEAVNATGADSAWRFDLKTWTWLMGLEGETGVGTLDVDVDADFGDVLSASDSLLGFSGRLEVGTGPLAGFVDGTWARIGAENRDGPGGVGRVDVTQELGVVDFGLMYRVYTGPLLGDAESVQGDTLIDVYGGARYITLGVELDPDGLPRRSVDKDWIDPIVGIKIVQPLTERLDVEIWGDVGGFGASSDITWSATAVVGFDFTLFNFPSTFYGGYRAVGWDYRDGSGVRAFKWDIIMHGPIIGIVVKF